MTEGMSFEADDDFNFYRFNFKVLIIEFIISGKLWVNIYNLLRF